MATQQHFHDVPGSIAESKKFKNYRSFEGDGTPILRVEGLQSVEAVLVDGVPIPETIKIEVPVDGAEIPKMETQESPGWQLTSDAISEILLRNTLSNDGNWQKGSKVLILGKFKGAAPATPAAPAPAPAATPATPPATTPAASTPASSTAPDANQAK